MPRKKKGGCISFKPERHFGRLYHQEPQLERPGLRVEKKAGFQPKTASAGSRFLQTARAPPSFRALFQHHEPMFGRLSHFTHPKHMALARGAGLTSKGGC